MRNIGIVVLSAAISSASAAGDSWHPIDLTQPGTLEALKAEQPAQFEAVSEVLRVTGRMACKSSELVALETKYDLHNIGCAAFILTSLPAKRHLTFQLGETHYVANVTIREGQ